MIKLFSYLILGCLLPVSCFSLSPSHNASLWEHLNEVNVQWERQALNPADFQAKWAFQNDNERIQMHLLLVGQMLQARSPEGLSAEQVFRRNDMLQRLERYALRGVFPLNAGHATRIPYFIDQVGTACAVGQLLIESGHQDFAQRIQREMNNAYLLDMPYPEIGEWAEAYGFTKEELAWIQPGYPPNTTWNPLTPGGNTDAQVNFVQEHPNQNGLVIGGAFTQLEGVNCDHVAYFDGQTISPMGTNGPDGRIWDLEWFDNKLYAGGDFSNGGGSNLATWDGSNWTYSSVYTGVIYALEVIGTRLYAGGDISHSGGMFVSNIVYSENGIWLSPGSGLDDMVYDLLEFQGQLYAAGQFTQSGQTVTSHVAMWDGQAWTAAGNGVDNVMRALAIHSDTLYVGGDFNQPNPSSPGLFRLTGNTWTGLLDTAFTATAGTHIDNIRFLNGEMYVSGGLVMNPWVGYIGNNMGLYIPTAEFLSAYLNADGQVLDMAVLNNDFVVGGTFTFLNGSSRTYLATNEVLLNLSEPALAQIKVFPQPMSDRVQVRLPAEWSIQQYQLQVLDLRGKQLDLNIQKEGEKFIVTNRGLSPGVYLLSLEKDGTRIWSDKLLVR